MDKENLIEGRNAVIEAFRAGKTIDKIFVQDGLRDGPVQTVIREAKKQKVYVNFVPKDRLDEMSFTKKHQGVIAAAASYSYSEIEDMLKDAEKKNEPPFLILLDGMEDPYNLGAIIRTAHQAGAHGVIIPEHRAVGLTASTARASAGALNYMPVAKVPNIGKTIDDLKKQGLWFACADMNGTCLYDLDLRGPLGLVIGGEGNGVGDLVRKKCDYTVSIPMKGKIDSLNASVAAGILSYEVVRQRRSPAAKTEAGKQ